MIPLDWKKLWFCVCAGIEELFLSLIHFSLNCEIFIPNAPFLIHSTFSLASFCSRKFFNFFLARTLEKSFMCTLNSTQLNSRRKKEISHVHASQSATWLDFILLQINFISHTLLILDSLHLISLSLIYSALSSNAGVLTINIDKLSVKEAIHNINYVRALAGIDHVGLGPTSSPRKYALLLAELARDRLWNNASLKKLVGGNIVRILREVS